MNGHSNIDPNEATEHLKNILNVGKTDSTQAKTVVSVENMDSTDVNRFTNETTFQSIELTGNEENVSIYGNEVAVYSSPLTRGINSSNIMLDTIVDYGWEQKYYLGHLVSIHLSKKYLAYSLKSPSTQYGFIRVIKHNTNSHLLLRGFKGGAQDLAFAHSLSRVMLGCVDEIGELFVYEIFEENLELLNRLCVHIVRPSNTPPSIYHRIMWCPYVPEDNSEEANDLSQEDDISMMSSLLVVTHSEKAEIWNIDMIIKEYGTGDIPVEKVGTGLQLISEHKEPITTAAFSPDAIALATASLDGEVKFFQVNTFENEVTPRCLHEWTPHDGRPLSCLFFLDNHKNYTADVQFWKFAVTGADNNQEIKVWSCKTWSCLQTIRFYPSELDRIYPCLKAEIDLSANYLLLSDINRKVLYILKISQESNPIISSLSEYVVKYPVLSFSILDVAAFKGKPSLNLKNSADEDEDEDEKEDEFDDSDSTDKRRLSYWVKLFWIHTKSFQSCRIMYMPKTDSPLESNASISSSQDSFVYKDGLADLSTDVPEQISMKDHVDIMRAQSAETGISPNKCVPASPPPAVLSSAVTTSLPPLLSSAYQECQEVLLTPKDFTSLHSNLSPAGVTNSFKMPDVEEASEHLGDAVNNQEEITSLDSQHNSRTRRKSSQHSCASSPSREVAEILSPSQILSHENETDSPQEKDDDIPTISGQGAVVCHSPVVRLQPEFASNDWPQAPNPNKEYKVVPTVDGEILLPHPSLEQSSLRHATMTDGDLSPGDLLNSSSTSVLQRLERSIEALSMKVSSIADTLQRQNQAFQYVQSDIQDLQQQQKYMQSNIQNLGALDNSITSKVANIIAENSVNDISRLENLFNERGSKDLQRSEQQSAALAGDVIGAVSNRLDQVLKQEVERAIIPYMSNHLDSLVQRLQGELLQKLNSTDNALKECLGKHLRSKAFGDTLAATAVSLLQHSIQVACKDVFQNSVMPSLDKCCQLLFSQMSEVFTKGSVDYVEKLDRHLQVTAMNQETMSKRCEEHVRRVAGDAQAMLTRMTAKAQETAADTVKEHERLLSQMKQVIQEEIKKSMKEQSSVAALRSRQATPAPQSDPQISPQYILQLAKQGEINEAFQQALSASDVKLVLFLCESVSVEQVFEPVPCLLKQHVLLSLIHQLSGDLNEKTEIKLRYIEDAIANLDDSNPVTKEHLGRLLGSLDQRISTFMKLNPNHKMIRLCKRIHLAIDSYLK